MSLDGNSRHREERELKMQIVSKAGENIPPRDDPIYAFLKASACH